ncbi:MAG: hypothetical protein Q9220_004695 [cf. Caloplaca sp. 1 TL-2023]
MPALTHRSPMTAHLPTDPERNSSTTNHNAHCSRACKIAIGTIIPLVFLAVVFTITFMVWGRPYLARRRREKSEKAIAREKLEEREEESSVGGSDVSTLDGGVGAREERRVEEGHEHDHALAMIAARP